MAPVISKKSEFDTKDGRPLCVLVEVGDRQIGGISASIEDNQITLISGEKKCFKNSVAVSGRALDIKVVIDGVQPGTKVTVTITLFAGPDNNQVEEYDLTEFVENGQITGDFRYDIY